MPLLCLHNISKIYGAVVALSSLSLSVECGEIFGLLGPSGCGKTTTLRMILGLEMPDSGTIEFQGRDITSTPPEQRGFGIVFQNYALFTALNVFDNVAFGPRASQLAEPEVQVRVEMALALVRLFGYGERSVNELSAGQQQRVAIARVIAAGPSLLLFDEPMANLDAGLRRETRRELRELVTRLNLTAVYVTHDQEEAFTLCDRVGVMREGHIIQTGAPREVYRHPAQAFIADFFGANQIHATALGTDHSGLAEFKTLDGNHILHVSALRGEVPAVNQSCVLVVRPEDVSVTADGSARKNVLAARVREVLFAGGTTRLRLNANGLRLDALLLHEGGISSGDDCLVELPPDRITVLPNE